MRNSVICIVVILAAVVVVRGYWQRSAKEAVAFTEDNELYLAAGDFDVYFKLHEEFSETYMLWIAQRETHKAAFKGF